jgi:putative membrane protein
MATASPSGLRGRVKDNVEAVTAVLSLVGYALVASVFLHSLPVPDLSQGTTLLFGDLIAVINTVALASMLAGVYFIRNRAIRKHRVAMLTAFGLILVFLVLYLWKVGGGFEKAIVIESGHFLGTYSGIVRPAYLIMLAIHILLSAAAVPVVLYAVLLGLTHTPAELEATRHALVGRVTVVVWSLSLGLGIITYWLLNHVYAWEIR